MSDDEVPPRYLFIWSIESTHTTTFYLQSTMVDNSQEYRLGYWATHLSVCSFARTAHSFASSALLASLACSAALIHSLAHSLIRFQAFQIVTLVLGQARLRSFVRSYRLLTCSVLLASLACSTAFAGSLTSVCITAPS